MTRIRVLVVDDSQTVRDAVCALLAEEASIEVVGVAADGEEAVRQAKLLRPDVITMDVQMPRLSGLEATTRIMAEAPSRILMVCAVAGGSNPEIDLSFKAIGAGALELIAKPAGTGPGELRAWGKRLAQSVRLMSEVKVVTRRQRDRVHALPPLNPQGRVDAVGLVASTGGPPALAALLAGLPAHFPAPVMVAQHMAPGFMAGLARWFASVCPLKVVIADPGAACQPGYVYLPPDERDLEVDPGGLIRLLPSAGGPCPSGDRLLTSLARAYADRAAGVVLTGMGEDGAAGLLAIRQAGGVTLAQDEASCVVYGMPQAAARLGAAGLVLSLETMAPTLRELCQHRATRLPV